jgi:hypothetical protein
MVLQLPNIKENILRHDLSRLQEEYNWLAEGLIA